MLKRSGFDSENGESRSWKRKRILYTCVPRKPRFPFLCSKEALGRGLISVKDITIHIDAGIGVPEEAYKEGRRIISS